MLLLMWHDEREIAKRIGRKQAVAINKFGRFGIFSYLCKVVSSAVFCASFCVKVLNGIPGRGLRCAGWGLG